MQPLSEDADVDDVVALDCKDDFLEKILMSWKLERKFDWNIFTWHQQPFMGGELDHTCATFEKPRTLKFLAKLIEILKSWLCKGLW